MTSGHREPHILHFCIFPLIIIFCMPVLFSFCTIFRGKEVSRARNKLHSISLLSFSCARIALLPSLEQSTVYKGREDKYVFAEVRAEEAHFQWKSDFHEKTLREMQSSKYHLDPSIIVLFSRRRSAKSLR